MEERYASHYLCIGSGRILRLADTIADQDTIEIIPQLWGLATRRELYERRFTGEGFRINLSDGRIWEEAPNEALYRIHRGKRCRSKVFIRL